MTDETKPDHDAEITICGEVYLFRRSHDVLRRVEQRFGALIPLADRVRRFAATQAELAGMYEELVRGDPSRPSRADLERWVWETGTPKVCPDLARALMELPLGNTTLRLLEEEKRVTAAEQRDQAAAGRPTEPAATELDLGKLASQLTEILARAG